MAREQASVHLVAATIGFLSLALIWLAVVWGIVLRNGWTGNRIKHATAYGIHQSLALTGLTLGAVHAFAQLAVPDGHVRVVDEFVPFANPVDPVGIGFGVIGLEVLTTIAVSVLLQRRLGYSRWRALHAFAYAAFMLLVAHALVSGTDVGPSWVWTGVLVLWLATVGLWVASTAWAAGLGRRVADRFTARQRVHEVLVNVDAVRCGRFGFCEHEAPEVFVLRSDGRLAHRAMVSADELPGVIRALEVCPMRAITIGRVPTQLNLEGVEAVPGPPRWGGRQ